MDANQENLERMKKLGLVKDEHGNFVMSPEALAAAAKAEGGEPAPAAATPAEPVAPVAAVPATPAVPAAPAPAAAPAAAPAPQSALTEDHVVALEKRAEAAKTEQRKLSQQQNENRRMLTELTALKDEIVALKASLTAAPAPAAAPQNEAIEALKTASPDLYAAILAMTQGSTQESLKPLLAQIEGFKGSQEVLARSAADIAFEKVTSAVEQARAGANALVNTDEFQAWLADQPDMIRIPAIQAIYENTAAANPKDILFVIGLYDKATAAPAPAAPAAPPAPAPRVVPALQPSAVTAGAPAGAGPGPLTEEELKNFGALKAAVAHDPAQLTQLMTRLRLTVHSQP